MLESYFIQRFLDPGGNGPKRFASGFLFKQNNSPEVNILKMIKIKLLKQYDLESWHRHC